MSVSRGRVGRKPGSSPGDAAGIEMETAVVRAGSAQMRHRLCLNSARQGLRGIALSIDIGPGRNDAAKGGISSRKAAPIKVRGSSPEGRTNRDTQKSWPHKPPGRAQQQTEPQALQPRRQEKPSANHHQKGSAQSGDKGPTECRDQHRRDPSFVHPEEQYGKNRGPWTTRSKSGANRKRPERPGTW